MKTSKVSDPKSISTKILKLFKNKISKPLSDITNLLKIANVIPFTKKMTSLIVITTDLFLFYLIFIKNVCTPV